MDAVNITDSLHGLAKIPLTRADCREIFEMETMLTAWLRIYGKIRIDIGPGYGWPRYWIGDRQINTRSGWVHKHTLGRHLIEPPEKPLRPIVLDVMRAHEAFYQQEFLSAVKCWREIAPGETVPTDKEVYNVAEHVKVVEHILSDGSKVYDVQWDTLVLNASSLDTAEELADILNAMIGAGEIVGYGGESY